MHTFNIDEVTTCYCKSNYCRTCFEWSPNTCSHFSLSSLIFHVYLMVNLSNAVPSLLLDKFMVTKMPVVAILVLFFLDWYPYAPSEIHKVSFGCSEASFRYQSKKEKLVASIFAVKSVTLICTGFYLKIF